MEPEEIDELNEAAAADTAEPGEIVETESPYRMSPIEPDGAEKPGDPAPKTRETVTFRRTHLYAVLLPLAFVLGLSVGYLFWGRDSGGAVPVAASSASSSETVAGSEPQTVRRYDVSVDDDYVLGPADAPITLIEFSDYECPYCRRFHAEVLYPLLEAFPGQIRFVYKDFPLTQIHPNAYPAALAANCAGEQGAYYDFHDALFSMQYGLGSTAYQQYAGDLGLDLPLFNACLESAKYQAEVQADFEFAANLGVSSTPTFFINGIPLVGAQPLDVFKQVIERELAGEFQ